jgi:hypothetical protein
MKLPRGILIDTTSTPKTAADEAGKTYRQTTAKLGPLGLDTAIPESVRSMAENSVDQTRTAYDRSTVAFDASVATFERSFDAAGQGAVALSRKVIDIARRNVSSSFDLAKSLAGAKSLTDMVEVQAALLAQAVRYHGGSGRVVPRPFDQVAADTAGSIKAHVARGADGHGRAAIGFTLYLFNRRHTP